MRIKILEFRGNVGKPVTRTRFLRDICPEPVLNYTDDSKAGQFDHWIKTSGLSSYMIRSDEPDFAKVVYTLKSKNGDYKLSISQSDFNLGFEQFTAEYPTLDENRKNLTLNRMSDVLDRRNAWYYLNNRIYSLWLGAYFAWTQG